MEYRLQTDCDNIDWASVCRVIAEAGLATHPAEVTEKAFRNSYRVVFVFAAGELVGVGRALSDGAYQAGIYDIAVLPALHGRKLGRLIIEELHKGLEGMNVVLYARPGVEPFYRKLGYSRMLTGMARFKAPALMREKGFIE
jgi:GNAT superfamily N-acetyltransferase